MARVKKNSLSLGASTKSSPEWYKAIETKWQKAWEKAGIFESNEGSGKKKYYISEMFPYPSAYFLHVGHMRNYVLGDLVARYKRMKGYNVLYPIGYDAFGLPAENAAIKEGIHPQKYTDQSIKKIREMLHFLGQSYDWSKEIATCSPEYYKWNQWIFLRMLEKGIAYKKKATVNWCPSCKTVLANEEASGGKCWRCDSDVTINHLEQWFLKITDYADELLKGLDALDWPERVKDLQRQWIGMSSGTKVLFPIEGSDKTLEVFTTRVDTIYGVSFLACAASHPLVAELVQGTSYEKEYRSFISGMSASEKLDVTKEKKGFFTGRYVIHPLTGDKIPLYAGSFVVSDYGTGVVMGVPAHDERDFEFAKKYKLPIKHVIVSKMGEVKGKAYVGSGVLKDSDVFNGLDSEVAKTRIAELLAKRGLGGKTVEYKLRDWLISRQRYWGTPIPIIYCKTCGTVPVPEKDLPVQLPSKVTFSGKGNPLETNKNFVNTICPVCGENARRETDTMATFFDSSWYFLRYCSPHSSDIFDRKSIGYWMPMDHYIGGIEHATLHLLYARFFTKFLRDIGWLVFDEPFTRLFNQGMVTKNGVKMSKSKGNVVTVEEASKQYGIDVSRLFLMFVAGPDKDMEWNDHGIEGMVRIARKFSELFDRVGGLSNPLMEHKVQVTLRAMEESYEKIEINKGLVHFIDLVNYLSEQKSVPRHILETTLLMIAPIMPHLSEELWHKLGGASLIAQELWPHIDESKIDASLAAAEKAIESTVSDIVNVLRLVKEKSGSEASDVYVYVLPGDRAHYDESRLSARVGKPVKVFAVNDKNKYDPSGKSSKAKPGRPALYVE